MQITSFNLHGVKSVEIQVMKAEETIWTNITFKGADGDEISLTAFAPGYRTPVEVLRLPPEFDLAASSQPEAPAEAPAVVDESAETE